jgi:hypothetical protein
MQESKESKAVVDDICEQIADGQSLSAACRSHGTTTQSFLRWCAKTAEYAEQYARAREARGVYYGERVASIAEKTLEGEYEPSAARVAVDALKWTAGRMAPKQYGDRLAAEISGPDGGPIQSVLDVSGLPTEALEAILHAKDAADQAGY